MIEEAPMG